MNDCPDCLAKKCEYGAAAENLLFCFSRGDAVIRLQNQQLAVPTLVNDHEEYHFIITPDSIQLLRLNLPLCSFDFADQHNTSFFHEILIDPGKLTHYVHEIFKSIRYVPMLKSVNPSSIKVKDVDSYLEKRRLTARSIDAEKAAAYENHGIDIQGFFRHG